MDRPALGDVVHRRKCLDLANARSSGRYEIEIVIPAVRRSTTRSISRQPDMHCGDVLPRFFLTLELIFDPRGGRAA